ncbi:MAG: PAS domain-containing protein [Bacteroidota bacterium]
MKKKNGAAELVLANKELEFQNLEKEKRALELIIANKELEFQNMEKENRATELNAANQHLKLLETVITNTPDSIFILKADSEESARIIFVNPAFTRMTGYSESEVLNKSPFLLTGPNSGSDTIEEQFGKNQERRIM